MHIVGTTGIGKGERWKHWESTCFCGIRGPRKQETYDYIKSLGLDLKNKKLLCISGGVGRNADALRSLGCEVTNSDIDEFTIQLGRKYYPKVKHIVYDVEDDPISGYDFVFYEAIFGRGFEWTLYKHMHKWKNHATVLPKQIHMKLFKFNSELIRTYYTQLEDVGTAYIKKELESGTVEGNLNYSEVEDMVIEDVTVDITDVKFEIPNCTTHEYQLIGLIETGQKDAFAGRFINAGLNMYFDEELNHFVIPGKSTMKGKEFWLTN
jgi:hypothetical protein